MTKPPFVLPKKPIDRHEVSFYVVNHYHDDPRIDHVRYVYHVNSTWAEVCPDRAGDRGVAFVNHWQVFTNGNFVARTRDGWDVFSSQDWTTARATYAEAKALAITWLKQSIVAKRKALATTEARLRALKARRTHEALG